MAKKRRRKKNGILRHLASLGFSNRLAIYILIFLAVGLVGGFYLARMSIYHQYSGALVCWTCIFSPIGTAASIVLSQIVHKSTVENSGADGEGIKYAAAKAGNFGFEDTSDDAPVI